MSPFSSGDRVAQQQHITPDGQTVMSRIASRSLAELDPTNECNFQRQIQTALAPLVTRLDSLEQRDDDLFGGKASKLLVKISNLETTVENLAARETDRGNSAVNDSGLRESVKRVEERLSELDQKLRTAHAEANRDQGSATPANDPSRSSHNVGPTLEYQVQVLNRRLEEYDKAATKRFDFLTRKVSTAGGEEMQSLQRRVEKLQQLVTNATGTSKGTRTEVEDAAVQALVKRVSVLEERLLGVPQKNSREFEARLVKMEKALVGQRTAEPDVFVELRNRLSGLEQASLAAALDTRFTTISEQMAKLNERIVDVDNRAEVGNLAASLTRVDESLQRDQATRPKDAQRSDFQDVRRRLNNVEEHARTAAAHHNANSSRSAGIEDRIRALEQARLSMQADNSQADKVNVGFKERLAKLEDSEIARATDRRFDGLSEALTRVREHIAADDSRERIALLSHSLAKTEERGAERDKDRVASQQLEAIKKRMTDLEKELHAASIAHAAGSSSINDLSRKVDGLSSCLKEEGEALTKLSQETAVLTAGHKDLKERMVDLADSSEGMRDWIRRVDEKSKTDDRAILSQMEISDRGSTARVDAVKESIEHLREELRTLSATHQAQQQRRETSLAEEIFRLRHRIEASEPDDDARRELSDLFHLMMERSFLPSPRTTTNAATAGTSGENQNASALEVSPIVGAPPAPRHRSLIEQLHCAADGNGQIQPDMTHNEALDIAHPPPSKRRRLDENEEDVVGGAPDRRSPSRRSGNASPVRLTIKPEDEESDDEPAEPTPRRSDRKGKGTNARLESMPGMVTGNAWKNLMVRQRRPRA